MHKLSDRLMHWQLMSLVQVQLRLKYYAPQVQPNWFRTHDLQIIHSALHVPMLALTTEPSGTILTMKFTATLSYRSQVNNAQALRWTDALAKLMYLVQVQLRQKYFAPQVRPNWGRTHDLQIIHSNFMSLRCSS